MLCSKCKVNTASFFYTQNINGKESSVALCKDCAESSGVGFGTVSPLFKSFFGSSMPNTKKSVDTKKCSLCALTFNDILSMGKVGCPECYNTFKDELSQTIRSIHGSAKHIGIAPSQYSAAKENKVPKSQEEILRQQLNDAIAKENYEEAAILRDKIKDLKGEK